MSEAPVLLANIGRRERRKRLLSGFGGIAAGAGLEAGLVLLGAPPWWRLLVFTAFWLGALGVMQASGHTWVALAARGARNMDAGEEAICDEGEKAKLRLQARAVYLEATIVAALLTGACQLLFG